MRLEDIIVFCCSLAFSDLGKKVKYKAKNMYIMSGFPNTKSEPQDRDRECALGSTCVWVGRHAGATCPDTHH